MHRRFLRRVLKQFTNEGSLASETPKGPVSLRFPSDTLDGANGLAPTGRIFERLVVIPHNDGVAESG